MGPTTKSDTSRDGELAGKVEPARNVSDPAQLLCG